MSKAVKICLPEEANKLTELDAGSEVHITGTIYTMRDAGHIRCLKYLEEYGELPFGLNGQTLFYAGPTPPRAGQPFGAIGPTTASRMDFAAPELYKAGIVATIGKGKRSVAVINACKEYNRVYLAAVGGIAAMLAKCITASECIAWKDLGTEALHKIEVVDLPVFVEIDANGNDLYREIQAN